MRLLAQSLCSTFTVRKEKQSLAFLSLMLSIAFCTVLVYMTLYLHYTLFLKQHIT